MSHKNPIKADLALLWHAVLSIMEPRAKKIVRKSYANCGYEPVNFRYIATGPPGAAVVEPDPALEKEKPKCGINETTNRTPTSRRANRCEAQPRRLSQRPHPRHRRRP